MRSASNDLATVEARRLATQVRLDAEKTAPERNQLGQFATPPTLAEEIARYAALLLVDRTAPIHFADPAIGTGAFFSALLRVVPEEHVASATGVEIDERFVQAAQQLWAGSVLRIVAGDFTNPAVAASCPQRPNLILANPPYVRHHHLDREDKARLQTRALRDVGLKVPGLAGLYVYFFLLASAWLASDGIAIWLIPSEFMDVNYGEVLKRYLTEQTSLVRIHRFDPHEGQFDDALVTSAVVVMRKQLPPPDATAQFTYGGTLLHPQHSQEVPFTELRRTAKWTTYPRVVGAPQTRQGGSNALRLGDLFKIQRGIATGANGFFILPRQEARARGLPEEFLRPILPSPRHLRQTTIERAPDGHPRLEEQLVLIDCDLLEEELRARSPALWAYLETAAASGLRDRYLISQRTPWYKQEQRPRAPFLSTYMGRSVDGKSPFRFIWNQSEATATNLYLVLYPIKALAEVLRHAPDREAAVFAILQEITGAEVRAENRVYGGGLHKIEPSELARVSATTFLERLPELNDTLHRDPARPGQLRLFV